MLFVLFAFFLAADAWWQQGHYAVGLIGYRQLSLSQRTKADALCASLSNWGASESFVESAYFADELKAMGLNAFNDWHYIDIPFVFGGNYTSNPPCVPISVNIVSMLSSLLSALRDRDASIGSRAFSLRMLTHLVGDISQPMHAATLYSPNFPQGDLGGNRFLLTTANGIRTNLHSFFDSAAYRLNSTYSAPFTSAQSAELDALCTMITTKYPIIEFTRDELSFNPTVWAQQSHDRAVVSAYLNGTLVPGSQVSQAYTDAVYEVCLRSLALGGYRLGLLVSQYIDSLPNISQKPDNTTLIIVVSVVVAFFGGILLGAVIFYGIKRLRRKRRRFVDEDAVGQPREDVKLIR